MLSTVLIFDLDGTLLDSDAALVAPFVRLGVPAGEVTFGHLLSDECERLGISLDDYLAAYDANEAQPYAGVQDVIDRLDRWAVCSNKHGPSGRAELDRLGWTPQVAMFTDDFGGFKTLAPVIEALGCPADSVVYVGDTHHDRLCAAAAGARFALAGWNPRAEAMDGDTVLARPELLLELLD